MLRTDMKLRGTLLTFLLLVVLFLLPSRAMANDGPSLQFSPTSVSGSVGDRVDVSIVIDTDGRNVDGVTADFTYPASILKVVDVSTPLSTFTNTAEENMSTPGIGKISRFLIGEYFKGVGEVAIITFEFRSIGNASLDFADNAMITYSGSNILENTSGSSVLGAETVAPEDPPANNNEIPVQKEPFNFFDISTWTRLDFLVMLFIVISFSAFGYAIYKKRFTVKN